ncbi:MAG TPA: superoxide dismutase family protein [Rubricoccaceae bacterium]|nr:superoxide dismutase family protein [Rubricoccaceae bacterium]
MTRLLPLCLVLGGAVLGCREPAPVSPTPSPDRSADSAAVPDSLLPPPDARAARAVLRPFPGHQARGVVTFEEVRGGVRVLAEVEGLSEEGLHALHVLDMRFCLTPDSLRRPVPANAPHFNPDRSRHGGPLALEGERHAGDLGNLRARDGTARYDRVDPLVHLREGRSVVGRAAVVHAGQDDFYTQPGGASGPILACGVIEGED